MFKTLFSGHNTILEGHKNI